MEMEIELEIGNETKKKTENTMTEINGEMKGFKSKTDGNTSIDDAIDPSTSYTANITPAPRLLTDKGETETTGIVVGEKVDDEEGARRIIEMLRGADVSCRISAANKLEEVAAALGQTRTREELLPFLMDGVDDEDEVLAAIALSLGKLMPYVGGPKHIFALLAPLEMLLAVEEIIVRENASRSMETISQSLPLNVYLSEYAALLVRLATREWYTARVSACTLIPSSYTRFDAKQRVEMLRYFFDLCRDAAPMVQRVASKNLGSMLKTVIECQCKTTLTSPALASSVAISGDTLSSESVHSSDLVLGAFLPLYEDLSANDQPDAVRLQTTENCIAFGEAVAVMRSETNFSSDSTACAEMIPRILPLIVNTIDDRSWRVRWTAASKFANVVSAFAPLEGSMDALVSAYERLLQDPEAEVRTAATLNLSKVAGCECMVKVEPTSITTITDSDNNAEQHAEDSKEDDTGPRINVAERLVKKVTTLTQDDSEIVRAALAMVITELAPILGKDDTILHLVPPILLLLRDSASEVRLNVISSLTFLNEVIGIDLLSQSLLPAIVDLAVDGKWRIRLAIIQHIPLLAKQLGKEFFSEKLIPLCMCWLKDDISSIRKAAVSNLKDLTVIFGAEWASIYLVPALSEIRENKSYLRRLTAVNALSLIASSMGSELARLELLPVILDMATDMVPNIRFNVARGLGELAVVCGSAARDSQIRPVLAILVDDSDRDVRYYAKKTLESLDSVGTTDSDGKPAAVVTS